MLIPNLFERMTPRAGEGSNAWFDYEHGPVWGVMTAEEREGKLYLAIYEWNCQDPGRGHAAEALTWLRARFDHISVIGIGELDEEGVGDISTVYWERQVEKGRVDAIFLDDGTEHVTGPGQEIARPRGRRFF